MTPIGALQFCRLLAIDLRHELDYGRVDDHVKLLTLDAMVRALLPWRDIGLLQHDNLRCAAAYLAGCIRTCPQATADRKVSAFAYVLGLAVGYGTPDAPAGQVSHLPAEATA
ncbi:MAG: hypothetical protein SF069_03090 [Phycisphaerae bacterium]|nr:hypothetical protein [Phycisphaerae bacterium]